MIKSMTGFAKAEAGEKNFHAVVEIRSVNGRYLEPQVKLPRELSQREYDLREILRAALTRGSVSVTVKIEHKATAPRKLNENVAVQYAGALESLKKKLKLKDVITLDHLLQFKEVFDADTEAEDVEMWRVAEKAVRTALKLHDEMRVNEGRELVKDFKNRVKEIETGLNKVEDMGSKRIPEERERLRARIAQLFESDEIDEQRLQMEIVLLADKLDISEECVRLRSHIKFFHETLDEKEAVGRKLNFLLQEMNREVNTIGSKCNDAAISHIVVGMKEELERIREQVQNVE